MSKLDLPRGLICLNKKRTRIVFSKDETKLIIVNTYYKGEGNRVGGTVKCVLKAKLILTGIMISNCMTINQGNRKRSCHSITYACQPCLQIMQHHGSLSTPQQCQVGHLFFIFLEIHENDVEMRGIQFQLVYMTCKSFQYPTSHGQKKNS